MFYFSYKNSLKLNWGKQNYKNYYKTYLLITLNDLMNSLILLISVISFS